MNDAFGVGGFERIGDLSAKAEEHSNLEGTKGDSVLQCCAIQKLHDDEQLVSILADLVNRANIGMIHVAGAGEGRGRR